MAISVDSLRSSRSKLLRLFGIPALALGVVIASSQLASGATMSLAVDYTPGSNAVATEVAPGSKVDLTATAPISDPGTTEQEIVQAIGSELKLSAVSDIIAPAGWVIYYSTDGTNWTYNPPTTPAGWAAVTHVKARGNLISEGPDSQGRQIASTDANAAQPTSGSFPTTTGSSGDGWDVFFDDSGHIFNVWHHNGSGSNQSVDCYKRTGERCHGSWPFAISSATTPVFTMHTNEQSTGWYDSVDKEIWFPTVYTSGGVNQVGFACLRVADVTLANKWCGGSAASAFVSAGTSQNVAGTTCVSGTTSANLYDCTGGLAQVGGKLYTWQTATGDLLCVDIRLNAGAGGACADGSNPSVSGSIGFTGITNVASTGNRWRPVVGEWGGRIYGSAGQYAKAVCVVAATQEACPGWTNARAITNKATRFFKVPDSQGNISAACFVALDTAPTCFDASGIDVTNSLTSNFRTKLAATYRSTYDAYSTYMPQVGTRLYWGDANWAVGGTGKIYCWDFALDNWCKNWTASGISDTNYQINVDPTNPYCIWSNSHDGVIQTYDAYTGQQGNCALPAPTAVFDAGAAVPRMACSATDALQAWKSFALTASFSYTAATLTVKNSSGSTVSGWVNVPINSGLVDLATLSVSDTGQTPTFVVSFTGRTDFGDVSARVTAIGGSPQLCLTPTAALACVAPTYDNSMLGPRTTTVTASGTAFAQNNTTTALDPDVKTVNIGATLLSQCDGGSITGRALVGSNPAAGALVSLKDSAGNTLNYPAGWPDASLIGTPIQQLTDSSGHYTFSNLVFGAFRVVFADTAAYNVNTSTVVTGGTGTTTDTGLPSTLSSNVLTLSSSVKTGVVNALYLSTPELTKAFEPKAVAPGQVATLIFKVAKADSSTKTSLGFRDTLPSGLTFANPPNITTTCVTTQTGYTVSSIANQFSVVNFGMGSALASCTYTVGVIASSSGEYINNGQNVTTTGLFKNTDAKLVVTDLTAGSFLCDANLYFYAERQLFRQDPSNNPPTKYAIGTKASAGTVNAIGRNPLDGFLYGVITKTGDGLTAGNLAKIKSDGSIEDKGAISGVTVANLSAVVGGDFDEAGNLVVKPSGGTPFYSIDISTRIATTVTITGASANNAADMAYFGGKFYLQSSTTLYKITKDAAPDYSWVAVAVSNALIANGNSGEIYVNGFGELTYNTIKNTGTRVQYSANNVDTHSLSAAVTTLYDVADYSNNDSDGASCNQVPKPTAFADTSTGPRNTLQTKNLLSNDTVVSSSTGVSYPLVASSIRLCKPQPPEVAPSCTVAPGQSFSVSGVGSYSVSATGVVSFMPAQDYSGTPNPISYQVTDTNGNTVTSTYTPEVLGNIPLAVDDYSSGSYDVVQTIDVPSNDYRSSAGALDMTSVRLCSDELNVPASCTLLTLIVANQGTYTVNPTTGVVSFDPLSTFTGTATPVSYSIADDAAQITTAKIYLEVAPQPPNALNDYTTGIQGATQSANLLANDQPGLGASFVAGSVLLCSSGQTAPTCSATAVTIAGKGTFTINSSSGQISFSPAANFTGTASISYVVSANSNQSTTAIYYPTVVPPPTLSPDTSSGQYNQVQTKTVLTNDQAGASASLDVTSVRICLVGDTSPNCTGTSLTVAGQGTYTVNTTSGQISFTPLSTFTGTASAITYSVADNYGQKAATTYTPAVGLPPAPTASPNISSGQYNTLQTVSPLANDTAGAVDFPLLASTLRLCAPMQTTPNCTLTSLVVSGQGTYTVNTTSGVVSFVPLNTFTGTADPVGYQASDSTSAVANSTITITVTPPAIPVLSPDASTGNYNSTQSQAVMANDTNFEAALVTSSIRICAVSDTAPSCSATTLVVAGQGTYTVNTISGQISFSPLASFTGTASAITYSVTDLTGQKASTTYTLFVSPPPPPTATNDQTSAPQNQAQSINLLTNDTPGSGTSLSASSVAICLVGANPCTGTTLTIAGVGSYVVANGVITFTPEPSYVGTNTISYTVKDVTGQQTTANYTATVYPAPVALNDYTTGIQGATQSANLLANDQPGLGASFVAGSVLLCSSGQTAPTCSATAVTIAGKGTFTINSSSGQISFSPAANFTGTASISYVVSANSNQSTTAIYYPTVVPPPTLSPDTSSGQYNQVQTKTVLTNDQAGASASLDVTSVRICLVGDTSPNCTGTSLTVAGQGTYTVNTTSGQISFTPLSTFTGTASAITYSVADNYGQKAATTYTPAVGLPPAPTASPNISSGQYNTLQTVSPLANDTAGAVDFPLLASTLRLCAPMQTTPNCTLTSLVVSGQGTYTVNTTSGVVSFVPLNTFTGTADPVGYQASDSTSAVANSTITITVTPPAIPVLSPDASTGNYNSTQSQAVMANDTNFEAALVTSSIRICAVSDTAPSCSATTLVVAGQGTYTVNTISGQISFSPLASFTGTASAITYSVTDLTGQKASTTYTLFVSPPPPPTATNDQTSAPQNQAQSINLLTNDTPGSGTSLSASSVAICLVGANPCTGTTLTIAGVGSYVVANGVITFTPEPSYVGTNTISYTVKDVTGQQTTANYTATVYPAPVALNDYTTGIQGATQSANLLANDQPGLGASFVAGSVLLCSSGQTAPTCSATAVTIAGKGTFTINSSSGQISFSPAANFTGTASISYVVSANSNQSTTAIYYPTVVPPPTLSPDTSSGQYNQVQTKTVLTNDQAGASASLDVTSVRICLVGDTSPNCTGTSLTVAGQGTYTVNTTSGQISFTPLSTFTGTASAITYSVADNYGQKAATTYTPAVDLPLPATASPDTSTGQYGAAQQIRALNNDVATQGQTFDVSTVALCDPGTSPAEVPPSCSALVVTVSDGVYTVDTYSGYVNFQPGSTFSGVAQWVRYQVIDTSGVVAHSRITPTVLPLYVAPPPPPVSPPVVIPEIPVEPQPVLPPKATADSKTGKLNQNSYFTPVKNDLPGSFSFSPTSIVLCAGSCVGIEPKQDTQVVASPQGKWSIQSGSSVVTFTPNWNWHGITKISYVIFDSFGQRASSTITVNIAPPPLPKVLVYTGVGPKLAATASISIPKLPAGPKEGDYIATITAPRLGASWSHKVFEGTSVKNVLNPLGLGHYSMTQLPGEAGNFAVAGHRLGNGGIFKNLHTFQKGDVITVKTQHGTFKYRYLAKKYVKPSMVGVLSPNPWGLAVKPKSGSLLTLQTCTAGNSSTNRLIVWFELVG